MAPGAMRGEVSAAEVDDADDALVGRVARVVGDRSTGEFAGLDIELGVDRPTRHVAASAVTRIGVGEIRLGTAKNAL